ncbi:MAG: HAD-IB family hydrolase [Gammaproteobacteria bacterium]|nr:HAD-IB family hydrolase [Gammaproteobacteria bacterium]MCW8841175.1 HAD-IB family hydrolase [Gammaproteobacteria bacterium]MCW8927697.1 HAD-IB family hydrolase [Gammaproteobacteria bacterium]MCW8958846.1 HAD-IB family hydrolase [Gammaproteobacteria bacterium]MCW8971671.1 HAD-IB family hydrolase [Gammaproteobacteria bacterium]
MRLAIFDLDNTLLGGDSDYLWGRFLVEQGIVDGEYYARENQRYYEEYKSGQLDIREFLRFSLSPLAKHDMATLQRWHQRFMKQKIAPIMLPKAADLLQKHRKKGDFLLIITATNRFVTGPIAETLGVDDMLATEPQMTNGRYTGEVEGVPCFQQGKVTRLRQWLNQTGYNLAGSWFYSDSHNDLPLLELVENPVAVDADETLSEHARLKGWPQISLRE